MKFAFHRQIFEKSSNIKLHLKLPSVGAKSFHADGQTDGHTNRQIDKAKSLVI